MSNDQLKSCERVLHTHEVAGSSPAVPTNLSNQPITTVTPCTHTPGPWRVDGNDVCTSTGDLIACAFSFPVNGKLEHTPETYANARLIAAAPELLKALTDLLNLIHLMEEYTPIYSNGEIYQAGRAIQKAKEDK